MLSELLLLEDGNLTDINRKRYTVSQNLPHGKEILDLNKKGTDFDLLLSLCHVISIIFTKGLELLLGQ